MDPVALSGIAARLVTFEPRVRPDTRPILYTVLLAAVSYLPATLGLSGGIYVALVSVLNLGYLREAWSLWRNYSDTKARHAFRYSLIYLTGLFAALFLDRLL